MTAVPPPAAREADRARFEAWVSAPPYERVVYRLPDDPAAYAWPGQYTDIEIQLAWEAWQASAADRLARGDALEKERDELRAWVVRETAAQSRLAEKGLRIAHTLEQTRARGDALAAKVREAVEALEDSGNAHVQDVLREGLAEWGAAPGAT